MKAETKTLKQQLQDKFDDILLRLFANVINIETAKKEIVKLGREWLEQKRQEKQQEKYSEYAKSDSVFIDEFLEELEK